MRTLLGVGVVLVVFMYIQAGLTLHDESHHNLRKSITKGHSFLNPTLLQYSNVAGHYHRFGRSLKSLEPAADNHSPARTLSTTATKPLFETNTTLSDDDQEFGYDRTTEVAESICNGTSYISWNDTYEDSLPCNITKDEYMAILYQYMHPNGVEWVLIILHITVFVGGLVGNALVCIAVYSNHSMRTVTNIFIVNLAVADFIVILVCLPATVVWDVTNTWFLGKTMCKIVSYFQSVSVTVSVLTLTFISVDRWYAICFPLRYRTKISRAIGFVAVIWIVALVFYIPEFLALELKHVKLRYDSVLFTQCATTWDTETERNFYFVRLVVLYALPLLLMMVAYFKIARVLWKSDTIPGHRESRNHQYSCHLRGSGMPASNSSTMGQLQARRKAAKMLVSVVIMFGVCFFPVHLFNILRYTESLENGSLTDSIFLISHWFCYANSAINPLIYNFMSGKFRKEFRNTLDKCRCSRVRVEDRFLNHSNPASRLNNISPSTRSQYHLTSVRDITRDMSRQTMQTTFIDNCVNGNSVNGNSINSAPATNHTKKDPTL